MTIKEVSQKYNISSDTLRYYERVGMIPPVKLCQQGDSTIEARMLLLKEQMETLLKQKAQIESTIKRLDFKISRYEEAVKTGKLTWE